MDNVTNNSYIDYLNLVHVTIWSYPEQLRLTQEFNVYKQKAQ